MQWLPKVSGSTVGNTVLHGSQVKGRGREELRKEGGKRGSGNRGGRGERTGRRGGVEDEEGEGERRERGRERGRERRNREQGVSHQNLQLSHDHLH